LPTAIRVSIVEDHPVFQEGLTLILMSQPDISVVAVAANGKEAVAEFRRHRPDITLMNQRLPGPTGTDEKQATLLLAAFASFTNVATRVSLRKAPDHEFLF
jgi:DNA-binding NarL/FixJ family response regulator